MANPRRDRLTKKADFLSLVVCCWLLVIGYWLLVIGYWLLVIGYWLLVIGYWLLVIGYWLLVIGYWLLVIGYWLLVIGYWAGKRSPLQAYCRLPIAQNLPPLPTAQDLLPTAHCLNN